MSTSAAVRRRRFIAGGVTLVVVAAVLVVAVRPFGGGAPSGDSVKQVAATAAPGSIELRPGFTLSWKQGAFADHGSVRGSKIASPSPPPDWFEPSGKPLEVTVEGARSQPLDLKWAPPSSPGGGSVPVVLHWNATDKAWSVVASGPAGAPATGATTSFSPHWPGWANPKKLAAAVTNIVHSVLGKRTQPPGCSGGPSWAELSPPAIDVVLTCLTTNRSADGTQRAEVQLKNNRGYLLEVPVPDGVAYASVEGQPELIRAAVRVFTGRDSVLLSPGQLLTIGFTQPSVGAPVRLDAAPTVVALAAQLVTELVADSNGLAAVVKAMSDCKVTPNVPFDVKPAINSVGDVGRAMLSCFASLFADPGRAGQLALEVIAAGANVDTTAAAGDRALVTRVDELAGKIRFVAVAIKVVDVGSDLIDYVADDWTNHRTGDYTGMSSQLSLKGSKAAASSGGVPAPFVGFWQLDIWSMRINANGTGTMSLNNGNTPVPNGNFSVTPVAGSSTTLTGKIVTSTGPPDAPASGSSITITRKPGVSGIFVSVAGFSGLTNFQFCPENEASCDLDKNGVPKNQTGFQAAAQKWKDGEQVSESHKNEYWRQAASSLTSGLTTDGGDTSGYATAIKELNSLVSIPKVDTTPEQQAEFQADVAALDAFFHTPGLYQ